MINILATADIHSPKYLSLFMKSLKETAAKPDLIILAGDLVEKNTIPAFKPIYNALLQKYEEIPIIAVYGNEEYRGYEYRYEELYRKIIWLNDKYVILSIRNYKIAIIGTRGALDKPTTWQARNIPEIYKYYKELPNKIAELVDEVRSKNIDLVILVSHYGVTYKDLEGEPRNIWAYLASNRFENIITSKGIDLVIHGHAHNGLIEQVFIGSTPVYNVSLPARGRIMYIEFKKVMKKRKNSLEKWFTT